MSCMGAWTQVYLGVDQRHLQGCCQGIGTCIHHAYQKSCMSRNN